MTSVQTEITINCVLLSFSLFEDVALVGPSAAPARAAGGPQLPGPGKLRRLPVCLQAEDLASHV